MTTSTKPIRAARVARVEWNDPASVDQLVAALDHPLKATLQAMRREILAVDPRITEGVKWNSPSFYCNGWFATANLRNKDAIVLVLHRGAKVKDNSTAGAQIDDPSGLLQWAAKERALVRFGSAADFNAKKLAFRTIVRQWVAALG